MKTLQISSSIALVIGLAMAIASTRLGIHQNAVLKQTTGEFIAQAALSVVGILIAVIAAFGLDRSTRKLGLSSIEIAHPIAWFQHNLYLFPVICLCLLAVLEFSFDSLFIQQSESKQSIDRLMLSLHWAEPSRDATVAIRELTALLSLEVIQITRFVVAVVTMCVALCVFGQYWQGLTLFQQRMLFLLGSLAVVLWMVMAWSDPWEDNVIFQALLSDRVPLSARSWLRPLVELGDIITHLTLIFVAVAVAVVVARPGKTVAEVGHQSNCLTALLYLSAALILIHVLYGGVDFLRQVALLPQDKEAQVVRKLAIAVSINIGVFYTMLLVGFHWPAAYAVSQNAVLLVKQTKPAASKQGQKAWLTEQGLSPTAMQYYLRVATVFSPLVVGFPLVTLLTYMYS